MPAPVVTMVSWSCTPLTSAACTPRVVVVVNFNDAGQTQQIVVNHRPRSALLSFSRVMLEKFAGSPWLSIGKAHRKRALPACARRPVQLRNAGSGSTVCGYGQLRSNRRNALLGIFNLRESPGLPAGCEDGRVSLGRCTSAANAPL